MSATLDSPWNPVLGNNWHLFVIAQPKFEVETEVIKVSFLLTTAATSCCELT